MQGEVQHARDVVIDELSCPDLPKICMASVHWVCVASVAQSDATGVARKSPAAWVSAVGRRGQQSNCEESALSAAAATETCNIWHPLMLPRQRHSIGSLKDEAGSQVNPAFALFVK